MKVQAVGHKRYTLGEGPHWDERSGTLLFVDGHGCQMLRYEPESRTETEVVRLENEIGNFIPYAEDNRKLVVCMGRGVYRLDLDTKEKTLLTEMIDKESPVPTRINDGKCDAAGRLWAGSMPAKIDSVDIESIVREKNNFWSFSKGQLKHKLDKVNLSNGITWTADNRTMFYNDSVPGRTYAFDFDVATGDISNKRVLLDFKETPGFRELGLPDGMTIDANDKIWLTCCLSGLVLQVDPETKKPSGTLLFVDGHGCQMLRYEPESRTETEVVRLENEIGNFIPYAEDNRKLVVCMGRGVYRLDLDTKEKTLLTEMIDKESPVPTRINDGKCDAAGRLWAGSMPAKIDSVDIESIVREKNNFWSFSKGQLKHKLDKVNLSNGITWTADNRTMFYNDSVPGRTYAFDFDVATGDISNKRVLLDFKETPGFRELGLPDGMTIDANDKIWLTCCLSGLVLQVDPETTKVLTKVSFPTKYTTSCCFGGRNYDTLYVTSGNFPPDATQPEDGLLYEVTELGVKGKAAFEFAG